MTEQFISTGKQSATISESMRAQAQLFRNLGDNVTAEKWETQARAEDKAEKTKQALENLKTILENNKGLAQFVNNK